MYATSVSNAKSKDTIEFGDFEWNGDKFISKDSV
jgi:hypothetical protein